MMFWDLDLHMHYVLGSSFCCRDGGQASCSLSLSLSLSGSALRAVVLDNTPAVGFVEETENEFENGNEEHGAG